LHLTASAVKIKFPNIVTISSEQLIEKVQDFPFSDYYDHMTRIMQNEQMKIEEATKSLRLKQPALSPQGTHNSNNLHGNFNANGTTLNSSTGFISKFREFFSNNQNDSNKQNQKNNGSYHIERNNNKIAKSSNLHLETDKKIFNKHDDEKN